MHRILSLSFCLCCQYSCQAGQFCPSGQLQKRQGQTICNLIFSKFRKDGQFSLIWDRTEQNTISIFVDAPLDTSSCQFNISMQIVSVPSYVGYGHSWKGSILKKDVLNLGWPQTNDVRLKISAMDMLAVWPDKFKSSYVRLNPNISPG